jgi:Tfp pilus assembly protein PilV
MSKRALSLAEVIISIFLLSFVALGVLSMARMAFVSQRRNENLLQATLVAQSVLAEIRVWAQDPDHYLSNWAAYNNQQMPAANVPEYTVKVRCQPAGRALDSPCQALESQWAGSPQGVRRMPRAVVPVEVTVAWGQRSTDAVVLLAYIGEPKRSLTGVVVNLTGPNPGSVAMTQNAEYTAEVRDAQNRPFENLLFKWSVDARYLSLQSQRDGRRCVIVRDKVVTPPVPTAPNLLPVQCYATYAGTSIPMVPKGVQLP